MPNLRVIPSIEQLRQRDRVVALQERYGRQAVVQALREATEELRRRLSEPPGTDVAGEWPASADEAAGLVEASLEGRLSRMFRSTLRRVINATGVIVHTNLGRAPLSPAAIDHIREIGSRYSSLEYDLERGGRGLRDRHAEQLLCRLTSAESAVVVNNNAAATMIVLAALAPGREVIVSRGELVEIGGGFRVPDVMVQSGAILREVGTTNRTRASDYAAAITERTALILRVHRSNFRIEGFTEQPSLQELVAVGHERAVIVAEDLGSGNLIGPMAAAGLSGSSPEWAAGLRAVLRDEPTVQGSLESGIDVLCVSGDKLLGGPQAGIILGRANLVQSIRRHPLMRALRVDKITYAALIGTLIEYAAGRAATTIPVIRMLAAAPDAVGARARRLADRLESSGLYDADIVDGESTIGGGTTPGLSLPTRLLALAHRSLSPDALEGAFRRQDPPIIARIERDRVVLDLRTVSDDEDELLAHLLCSIT
ncbi:MAG: L-seryl-tRNA(Sec) selenium transferase [Acidobacteriota bacterium]